MEKVLALCGVVVGGAIVTTLTDQVVGVKIEGFWPHMIHTVVYLMWGLAIARVTNYCSLRR